MLWAFPASLLGNLIAAIAQFRKGYKVRGIISLMLLPVTALIVFYGIGFLVMNALFSEEPDNFGKDIVIPATMQVTDPVDQFDETGQPAKDDLTDAIIAAFKTNNIEKIPPQVSTDLAILNEFGNTNRQRLIEHLAASPRWFVTEENGKQYAYRRFLVDKKWNNSLHGFYSSFEVAPSAQPHFQTRILIGFDGPVFSDPFEKKSTKVRVNSGPVPIRVIDDKESHQGKESYLVLQSSRACLEVFEQSGSDARPITQLALKEVKRELESALKEVTRPVENPTESYYREEPRIELANGMQGGIYQVRAFVNPREGGRVYLKVFEATRNTPLSEDRLKPRSTARIGWSKNPTEMFRYQSEITVYEGDWGTYYPARFELWFVPDSGAAERKLIERIFKIEGWMR